MTAEVIVMNKSAIALAADSKVTVGGSRASKTYDTVNKLFTLSKFHPVGIMIYGNAEFMDYPWETIIKMYRRQKRGHDESTIEDWSEDFLKYLRKFGDIKPDHMEKNLRDVCRSWFSSVLDDADDTAFAEDVTIGSAEYIALLIDIITSKTAAIFEKEEWLVDEKAQAFIDQFGSAVDAITAEYFHGYGNDDLNKHADRLISAAILAKYPSPRSSGIVIAGFGREEYFPTIVSIETDGYIGREIKVYREGFVDIDRKISACVRAFAQGEMVQRFMSGVDSELGSLLMSAFHETLSESCLAVIDKYGSRNNKTNKVKEQVRAAAREAVAKLAETVRNYTTINFSSPIVNMVSLLPKDELANLAESLVALTSLKRRVSSDAETVGGAIDVALISKGDGFVWVKRKYYFPEELNPQFNRMYLQKTEGEEDEGRQEPGAPVRAPRRARKRSPSKDVPKRAGGSDQSKT